MFRDSNKKEYIRSWSEYWDSPEKLFASSKQAELHSRKIFKQIKHVTNISKGDRILDYGCGKALSTHLFIEEGIIVLLYDKSKYFNEFIKQRFSNIKGVKILDDQTIYEIKDNSLDFFLLSSIVQYLSGRELNNILRFAAHTLKSGGKLILADIIPKKKRFIFSDWVSLVSNTIQHGFLLDTIFSILYSPRYRSVKKNIKLKKYDELDLRDWLSPHGFNLHKSEIIVGTNPFRFTYIAEKII